MTTKAEFERKIIKIDSGCWIWTAGKTDYGYGRVYFCGKRMLAHRASVILYKSENPGKLFVCHKCDNPSCVNPDHLFLGTQKDNINDAQAKGRMPSSPHPSYSSYTQGCRCDDCLKARNIYRKSRLKIDRNRLAYNSYKRNYRLKKKEALCMG